MVTRSVRRAVLTLAAVLVVAGFIAGMWARAHYHAWPWESVPEQLSVCGRDYLGPGRAVSMAEIAASGNHVIGRVQTFRGSHEIWGTADGSAGDRCGLAVYVRTGSRSFRAYGLSGGP